MNPHTSSLLYFRVSVTLHILMSALLCISCGDPCESFLGLDTPCKDLRSVGDASVEDDAGASDASVRPDSSIPTECTTSAQCGHRLPRCVGNLCSPCLEHADCSAFIDTAACGPDGECVECTESQAGACSATNSVCLAGGSECVSCNVDTDCPDPAGAKCDTTTHECVSCDDSSQCASRTDGLNVCSEGSCVGCTPATEVTDCGDNACDPDTFACTSTRRGSLGTCRACRSDSECGADRKCVQVPFMGAAGGYYCMQLEPEAAECPLPYQGPVLTAASKSGAPAARYCAHNTNVTTCEAVNALTSNKSCTAETVEVDCGPGARCEPRPTVLKCTYSCSSDLTCPADAPCNDEGGSPNPYCGGR